MANLIIKPFKKLYLTEDGERVSLQPVVCSVCGYDSAMDEIESHNYCPNCGEPIEDIQGKIMDM